MGRRTTLSTSVRDRLVAASKLGLTRDLQAQYAGIGTSTLHRWLAKGRQAKRGRYRELWESLKRAEAEGAVDAMQRIADAQEKDWKAAAWLLERRHGYRRGGPAEARNERAVDELADEDQVAQLRRQLAEVEGANRRALTDGSFQAYFAGKRLAMQLSRELIAVTGTTEDGAIEDLSSDAFELEFRAAAEQWPDQILEIAIGVFEVRHGLKLVRVVEGGRA